MMTAERRIESVTLGRSLPGARYSVIKVLDSDSGEIIRQIPSEEMLAIATYFKEVRDSAEQSEVAPGLLFSDST